jgi:D-arabinose 1-dehydrogenase-like Zn-dependent alcohol dehydrogenase
MSDESRDEINISHIPVSGIGGLGMVAVAVAVMVGCRSFAGWESRHSSARPRSV